MIKDNVIIYCSIITIDGQLIDKKAKNATECIAQKEDHMVLIAYK
jgi:hypothetical protein